MDELSCSIWGKILGFLTMPIIKGALIPYCVKNVAVDIQVYTLKNVPYVFKRRLYKVPGRKPIEFISYMKMQSKNEALEYVGAGLGMRLEAYVKDENLYLKVGDIFGILDCLKFQFLICFLLERLIYVISI